MTQMKQNEISYAPKLVRQLSVEYNSLETAYHHYVHQSCFLSWNDHLVRTKPCTNSDLVVTTVMAASHEPAYQLGFQEHGIPSP